MLFYFSATGNTKHVVDKIKLNNETIISIEEATRKSTYQFQLSGSRLGIITPTYDFVLPSIVEEFLQKLDVRFDNKPYTFYVGTYGTTTGAASAITDAIMKPKGLALDAKFDICMPDTWTVLFDLSNKKEVAETITKAEAEIDELKKQLSAKVTGKHMGPTAPKCAGAIGKLIYDNKVRKTKKLSVSETCSGCGSCAKKCPVRAIEMKGKMPVWVKQECTMCLGCLHRCPNYSIYYGNGKATNAHGQYTYRKAASEMKELCS